MEPPFDCDGKITPSAMIDSQAIHKNLIVTGEMTNIFDCKVFEITDYGRVDRTTEDASRVVMPKRSVYIAGTKPSVKTVATTRPKAITLAIP